MKSILITGTAGFIGSNLAEELIKQGWNVIGLDNLFYGNMENLQSIMSDNHFTFIKGDIRDKELLTKIIKEHNIEYISHFITLIFLQVRKVLRRTLPFLHLFLRLFPQLGILGMLLVPS